MRQWTPEERQRQREKIKEWQPWKTVGEKSPEVKARCRKNALKHGYYSAENRMVLDYLRHVKIILKALK